MTNVAFNIERACRLFPSKLALRFEGRDYTYHHLNQLVNRFANSLRALEVQRGDRVALFLPNIPEFVIAYLAAQKIGAIAVSLNAMLKRDEVHFILEDSGARVLITTAPLRAQVPDDELPALEHIVLAEGEAKANGDLKMEELMEKASSEAWAVSMGRDDPAAIVYTSGTTGFPKGAMLSHGNIISNAYSKLHYCGIKPDDRILLFLPLFHCFGQNAILNSALLGCATLVLQRRFTVEHSLPAITREGISMFFGVPTLYIRLLNMDPRAYDFSTVRYFFSAAAILPEEIAQRWFEVHGQLIYIGYGLTETSPFASYNNELKYKFGSVGTPIENVSMKVVDVDDGHEVAPGESGEIVIRGPNVMLGYWNRPEATAEAIRDGWFHSGDIGTMDEDGYFYVVDRLKDMINVSGFKVYPAEVENVLYKHPAVAEAAVYGVPHPVRGETVKAHIVCRPDHSLTEQKIISFCREKMAVYKAPRAVEFVDSIPKNAPGKVLKRVIRQADLQEQEQN